MSRDRRKSGPLSTQGKLMIMKPRREPNLAWQCNYEEQPNDNRFEARPSPFNRDAMTCNYSRFFQTKSPRFWQTNFSIFVIPFFSSPLPWRLSIDVRFYHQFWNKLLFVNWTHILFSIFWACISLFYVFSKNESI